MADQPRPEGGEQRHQVQLEPGSQRGSPRQEALPAGGGRRGPSLCSVLRWAPQGKRGGAMLERRGHAGENAQPVAPPTVRWDRAVNQLEPTAPSAGSTELCWHRAALGGGRVWPSSADQAPATRFPSSLSPAGPHPWCTARVLLSRAGWARPTAAVAPGGLPPWLGDRGARPGPAAAAFLMPAVLCSAGTLSPMQSRC